MGGAGSSLLHFSSCGERGLLLIVEQRLRALEGLVFAARGLGSADSVVAPGLSGPEACGIFLDQGSNSRPLHWKTDSYPLAPQESSLHIIFKQNMPDIINDDFNCTGDSHAPAVA